MEKGIELYKHFIDELVKISKNCVDANNVKNGVFIGDVSKKEGMDAVLQKLSDEDKANLADFVSDTYSDAVFDVLDYLEWLRECRNLEIKIDDTALSMGEFEGIPNDYIGRRQGWQWSK